MRVSNDGKFDGNTPLPSRESRFFPASVFAESDPAPREWLVPDLIPSGTVTLLGGDGGTGKSLLALQLAVSVATDRAWLGLGVGSGAALFISAEDDQDELHRRVVDIAQAEALSLHDLGKLTIRSLAGEDALLANLNPSTGALATTSLYKEVEDQAQASQPRLIVLDTLADLFPGNENDRAQARQFIGMLRGLAIRHQCAVVLLQHPSLSGMNSGSGTSGSTGWNNSVRSRLYLERVKEGNYETDPDVRTLSTKKANYSRSGGQVSIKWMAGVFVAEQAEQGLDKLAVNAKAERVFLKLLTTFTEQGRTVNHAGGINYAPKHFAEHPDSEGMTKRAMKGAMESLLTKEKIAIEIHGPPSKRRSHLVVRA
ncbi:putative P-loop containing nucleotide triphosphate hydrolase superfamily protein [Octadecabacter arcticus 238]|uniref:Putative P-loop containing nucleotide triphosphate hydrolase superfamily protein n=1 Tax=Octadecabacter arcticus 238 TaxID=391616 RepID=M9RIZ0_9RHOB|nr:AAA family ATPase [Octadecabacter arcticus]AGI71748.1 putative P-loop containing nucleotide triphosphate hydrolase superfamily protein [Octadecabacter arcticus 238]